MINSQKQRGFTIVELIVVIVVIAILAAITLVAYDSIQKRAMDSNIKSTLNDVGKAMLIKESDGVKPATGYFHNSNGVDDVVTPDYMPVGYRKDLMSDNSKDTPTNTTNKDSNIYRHYTCNTGGFVLFASLSKPSSDDISNMEALRSQCGVSTAQAPTAGDYRYNYAKLFK